LSGDWLTLESSRLQGEGEFATNRVHMPNVRAYRE
jgi:hypothetical protein